MKTIDPQGKAKAGLVCATLLFGTIGVCVRNIPLPSGAIALARGVIGTLFLLAATLLRGRRLSRADIRRDLLPLCLSGASIGANWILLFEAYRRTSVATATLCYYFAPTFVVLASPFLFHERLTLKKLLCAAAAVFGLALASGALGGGGARLGGIAFGLGAAALYACVILLNKSALHAAAFDRTVVQLGAASLLLLPYVLLAERSALAAGLSALTPRAALLLFTVGVVQTGAGYALYFSSIKALPAQTVALLSYIDPVSAIALSALLLGERMTPLMIFGAVLVLGAALFGELSASKPPKTEDGTQDKGV